jgi:hypothetical protein
MIILPPIRIAQGEPFAYQARVTGQSWLGYSGQAVFRLKRRVRRTAFNWNGYGYLSQTDPIVSVAVTGDATGLMSFSLTAAQALRFPSLPRRGSFVTAQGEITMGNGADQRKYQFDVAVSEALDAVIHPGGGGGVIVPPVILPAVNVALPVLAGIGKVGATHTVSTGVWSNAVSFLYRWKRNGAVIAGATQASYTPVSVDNVTTLLAEVAALNSAGALSPYSASNSTDITLVAPLASGTIPNVAWQQNVAITSIPMASYFTGSSLVYSYAPFIAGVTINALTGIISGTPTGVFADTALTVTATNSGGFVTRLFNAQSLASATVLSSLSIVSNAFQYSYTSTGTAYWAITDTSVAALAGAILEAQTTGYDKGTFAVGGGAETDGVAFATTPAGVRRVHMVVKAGAAYSNVATFDFELAIGASADVTAPVLSTPAGTQTGATTATGNVTTNEVGGTVYRVTTQSATAPTQIQVEAGQNHLGATAVAYSNLDVAATGLQTMATIAGLTGSNGYYNHYMHKDAAGNRSAVVSSGLFTTAAGGTTQRNPYSGFDDAAAYVLTTGVTISASKLRYANPTQFDEIQQNYGFRTPVTPSIPYTIALTADDVTAGPKTFQIIAQFWQGQQFAGPPPNGGPSTILAETSSGDLSFITGETKSFVVTPPADCTHIQLVLSVRQASTTAVFDNFTVTG